MRRELGRGGAAARRDADLKPPRRRPASRARLPRAIESDPDAAERVALLLAHGRPLWREGEILVPRAPLDAALEAALRRAQRAGQLVRGLEGAEEALAAEEKGLRHAERASAVPRGARVSRLLLLADDGAVRFYRQAEALLRRHAPRIVAVRLETDAATLGGLLFGPGRPARAVLLERKESVAAALLAIAATLRPGSGPARSG